MEQTDSILISPEKKENHGARDAFLYLISFFLLFHSVPAIGAIFFQIINKFVPDIAVRAYSSSMSYTETMVRWSVATLIISAPIYFILNWFINRQLKSGVMNLKSGIRRWLTYLSLFIASVTVIVDVIVILNKFLSGEIGTRFILKALVVLLLAVFVFTYYLWDIKSEPEKSSGIRAIFMIVALLITLAAIVCGFLVTSSPQSAREKLIDENRVRSLVTLYNHISNYSYKENKLPGKLEDITLTSGNHIAPKDLTDPETKKPYEYKVTGENTYELCATFATSNIDNSYDGWRHNAGQTCFKKEGSVKLLKTP